MNYKSFKNIWNTWGKEDPYWAVLSTDELRGNKWDQDTFFATGEAEIERLIVNLKTFGIELPKSSNVLDFGCGLGRLSRALASRFDNVSGVDVSENMIEEAKKLNSEFSINFLANSEPNLKLFVDNQFDLIFSYITLQHTPEKFILRFVEEFMRILKPGGVLVFQLPSHLKSPGIKSKVFRSLPNSVKNLYRKIKYRNTSFFEMNGCRIDMVVEVLSRNGASSIKIVSLNQGAGEQWYDFMYFVGK